MRQLEKDINRAAREVADSSKAALRLTARGFEQMGKSIGKVMPKSYYEMEQPSEEAVREMSDTMAPFFPQPYDQVERKAAQARAKLTMCYAYMSARGTFFSESCVRAGFRGITTSRRNHVVLLFCFVRALDGC